MIHAYLMLVCDLFALACCASEVYAVMVAPNPYDLVTVEHVLDVDWQYWHEPQVVVNRRMAALEDQYARAA